jgi:hypothetical protein
MDLKKEPWYGIAIVIGISIVGIMMLSALAFAGHVPFKFQGGSAHINLSASTGNTIYVSTNGTDAAGCGSISSPCASLVYAVSVAPSNSVIIMAPGNYTFMFPAVITKPLTITSNTRNYRNSGVFLIASDHMVLQSATDAVIQLGGTSNMTANAGSGVVGSITIEGLNFIGAGIEVPGVGAGNVKILRNSFTHLFVEAIGYHGNSNLKAPLGENFTISHNLIDNITAFPQSGIFLDNLQNSTISFNKIENTAYAGIIDTAFSQGGNANNKFIGNKIENVPNQGMQIAFGSNIMVKDNYVKNAGMAGNVIGKACAICLYNANQNNITVEFNTMTKSYQGFAVGQAASSMGNGIRVEYNNIFNNANAGADNNAVSGALKATYNWWGCAHGPNTHGCGSTVGNVVYLPFLTMPVAPMFPHMPKQLNQLNSPDMHHHHQGFYMQQYLHHGFN